MITYSIIESVLTVTAVHWLSCYLSNSKVLQPVAGVRKKNTDTPRVAGAPRIAVARSATTTRADRLVLNEIVTSSQSDSQNCYNFNLIVPLLQSTKKKFAEFQDFKINDTMLDDGTNNYRLTR